MGQTHFLEPHRKIWNSVMGYCSGSVLRVKGRGDRTHLFVEYVQVSSDNAKTSLRVTAQDFTVLIWRYQLLLYQTVRGLLRKVTRG